MLCLREGICFLQSLLLAKLGLTLCYAMLVLRHFFPACAAAAGQTAMLMLCLCLCLCLRQGISFFQSLLLLPLFVLLQGLILCYAMLALRHFFLQSLGNNLKGTDE